MPFTAVSGAQIYWKLEGCDTAPALVLLNSIGTDMDLWDDMLPALRRRFRLLRIDTRGHGASVTEPADFSLGLLARDVLAVADDAAIERFSVAGVSLGGMIGMQLALDVPTRVERLALICTSAMMDSTAWNDRIEKVRNQGMAFIVDLVMARLLSDAYRANRPDMAATLERQLLTMQADGYAGCAAAIRDMELGSRLGAIACPTLVVTGTRDISTPFEGHGEHLLAGISGARHNGIEAAHLAPLDAPDALTNALLASFGIECS